MVFKVFRPYKVGEGDDSAGGILLTLKIIINKSKSGVGSIHPCVPREVTNVTP